MDFFESDFGVWLSIAFLASILISLLRTMHDFFERLGKGRGAVQKTFSEMTNGELIHELSANEGWELLLCGEVCERAGLSESFSPLLKRSFHWSEEDKTLFDSLMGRALLCLVKQGENYCPLDDEFPEGCFADDEPEDAPPTSVNGEGERNS